MHHYYHSFCIYFLKKCPARSTYPCGILAGFVFGEHYGEIPCFFYSAEILTNDLKIGSNDFIEESQNGLIFFFFTYKGPIVDGEIHSFQSNFPFNWWVLKHMKHDNIEVRGNRQCWMPCAGGSNFPGVLIRTKVGKLMLEPFEDDRHFGGLPGEKKNWPHGFNG